MAIASIPYGFVQARGVGPWRLGDQAAVIPSFTGDGIAIALHSARMAADYYLSGKGCSAFQGDLARDVTRQVLRASLLSRLLALPKAQATAMAFARLAPSLVRHIACATRIPSRRLTNA
jgi:flavin-dependent dehydrogenase